VEGNTSTICCMHRRAAMATVFFPFSSSCAFVSLAFSCLPKRDSRFPIATGHEEKRKRGRERGRVQ